MVLGDSADFQVGGRTSESEELIAQMQGWGVPNRVHFPLQDLLMLDWLMPRKKGSEMLEWLQSQPFANLIVVVLSASNQREEIRRAMQTANPGANPPGGQKREELAKMLERYLIRGK
jgi:CheY-like chemotaxis protein